MDAFKLSAELRYANYNAVETTADINVCKFDDLPEQKELGVNRHMQSGICVMLHNRSEETVLEVRGYDENQQEFSYKFHYEKASTRKQSLAMRAVDAGGEVKKLNVSLDPSSPSRAINIIQK